MKTVKETVLKGVVKVLDKTVQGACGSKSAWLSYEPEMPVALKQAKLGAKKHM